jgi:hypothetical protein
LHESFQELLAAYEPPGYMEEKARITAAVLDGLDPEAYRMADNRATRKAARVGLRQLLHTCLAAPGLEAWLAVFDRRAGRCAADADDP